MLIPPSISSTLSSTQKIQCSINAIRTRQNHADITRALIKAGQCSSRDNQREYVAVLAPRRGSRPRQVNAAFQGPEAGLTCASSRPAFGMRTTQADDTIRPFPSPRDAAIWGKINTIFWRKETPADLLTRPMLVANRALNEPQQSRTKARAGLSPLFATSSGTQ